MTAVLLTLAAGCKPKTALAPDQPPAKTTGVLCPLTADEVTGFFSLGNFPPPPTEPA